MKIAIHSAEEEGSGSIQLNTLSIPPLLEQHPAVVLSLLSTRTEPVVERSHNHSLSNYQDQAWAKVNDR